MVRRIRLRKYETAHTNFHWLGAFRFRAEVVEARGMDPNVFLYKRDPPDPETGAVRDVFVTVCGPVDMEEYPVDAPSPIAAFPFYRKKTVELDVRTVGLAHDTYRLIKEEICRLCQALDLLEKLRLAEDIWLCSPPPADPASDSASASVSASASLSVSL